MRLVGVVDKQEEKNILEKVIAQYAIEMNDFTPKEGTSKPGEGDVWGARAHAAFIDQFVQAKINTYGRFYLDVTGLTSAEKNALIEGVV